MKISTTRHHLLPFFGNSLVVQTVHCRPFELRRLNWRLLCGTAVSQMPFDHLPSPARADENPQLHWNDWILLSFGRIWTRHRWAEIDIFDHRHRFDHLNLFLFLFLAHGNGSFGLSAIHGWCDILNGHRIRLSSFGRNENGKKMNYFRFVIKCQCGSWTRVRRMCLDTSPNPA